MKKTRILAVLVALSLLSGCSAPRQDSVEDPLNAFSIDAVVPFATVAPEAVATPTPKPQQVVNTEPKAVDQLWKDDVLTPTEKPESQQGSYNLLMRGDKNEDVTMLQQRLKELGYYTGTVDGDYGTGTVNAVKAFENALGQTQTGVASTSLQRKLFADTAPRGSGTVSTNKTATAQSAATTQKTTSTSTSTTTTSGYTMLKKGDTGSKVSKLQDRLKELGYYSGSVDGDYGTGTVTAVKKFQKALGMEQTGTATAALQKKLFASSAPENTVKATAAPTQTPVTTGYTELSRGDAGTAVRKLQKRLKELGYYTGTVDGDYGTATVNAVKKFEKAYGKTQTGIATVSLQKKLFADSAIAYGEEEYEEEETYTTLSPGDTGDEVKKLQRRLKELGWFEGDIGGNYLTKTTTAVKAFQKACGLSQTGIATVALQKKLFGSSAPEANAATPAPDGYETLSRGDNNDAVKRMQERLTELGYYSGPVNGNFGAKTEAAVKKFEAAYDRTQTGVATEQLQKTLFSPTARVCTEDIEPVPTETTYKVLKRGSNGSLVKRMQQRLNDLGYYDGPINGNFGAKTESAVLLFQQALGMEGTGVATGEMQEVLYDDDAPGVNAHNSFDGDNALRKGDEGEAVTKLQKRLVALGYLTSISTVNKGVYDAKTMNAVIDAQLDRDVETDGVATEDFLDYIYSDEAEKLVKQLYG